MTNSGFDGGVGLPDSPSTEGLELELRELAGVECVTFVEQDAVTIIEIGTDGSVDETPLTIEVARLSQPYLDTKIEVRLIKEVPVVPMPIVADAGPRVELLTKVATTEEGTPERMEIHLAHQGQRAVAGAGAQDPVEVAEAVIAGLRHLGFPLPFEVEAVHVLSADLGAGVLVVMVDRVTGERRRGLADRRTLEEAIPRAVLNGLNRYLQTTDRPPR